MAELDTNMETTETTETTETVDTADVVDTEAAESAELARLRAEMAKQKAALDKATKEAAESKRALRAKQSAEETAAEEAKAAQIAMQEELAQLRKERSVATTSKKVYTFIQDEATANTVAEYLYGAEDVDAAIDAINKAWAAREKRLRLELGKIAAPGSGSSDGPTVTKSQLDAMSYTERAKFLTEHPEEYRKLMGR